MAVEWNPLDTHVNFTLSNDNRTLTKNAHSWVSARSSSEIGIKVYFEYVVGSPAVYSPYAGIGRAIISTSTYIGATSDAWCIYDNECRNGDSNTRATGVTIGNGKTIGIAVDPAAGKIWFAVNNVWVLSGNPSTGANPVFTNVPAFGTFPMVSSFWSGDKTTANWASAHFIYSPPAGFNIMGISYGINGTITDTSKIYIINENNRILENTVTKNAGAYSIPVIGNNLRTVLARRISDSATQSFCNVLPVLPAP